MGGWVRACVWVCICRVCVCVCVVCVGVWDMGCGVRVCPACGEFLEFFV